MTNSAEFVEKEIIMQAFHMSKSQKKDYRLHILSKDIEEINNQTPRDKIYNM